MIKIAIDARFIVQERRGIGHYSFNLVKELVLLNGDIHYYFYIDREDTVNVLPKGNNITIRKLSSTIYPIWEQVLLPFYLLFDNIDVLHCLGNTGPIYSLKSYKKVVTLHDVMFLKPEFKSKNLYQKLGTLYKSVVSPIVAKMYDRILTVSEFSKRDIAETLFISEDKINVIYNSSHINSPNNEDEKSKKECRQFLAIGGNDKRKNNYRVLEAFRKVSEIYDCSLVIVGFTKHGKDEFATIVQENQIKNVTLLGYVSDQDMIRLFNESYLLYYPSLYEGFGIPLLEAMKAGIPVIASNTTSIPEVLGDAGLLVNPLSVSEIVDATIRLLNDYALCKQMANNGYVQSRKFSWENTAKETLSVYKELCDT